MRGVLFGDGKKNKGFSLIELIVAVAIMVVIVGVVTPMFVQYINKSKRARDLATGERIGMLANIALISDDKAYGAWESWEKLKVKVKELEVKIEPRLLTSFKRIRKNARNGLGIVYVQRDACGDCFNKIPPQRQLDIKMHKKVIVCEYCGRILIDPELAGVKIATPGAEEKKPRKRAIRKTVKKDEDIVPEAED